ncbi:hypothetical protein, partial [Pseudomonas syringae group genomosp. 7]|uniref:hypothetical protein n=1 Tax=Pseudomonas syringae group genomosp. 7 TaxID=251699 RepID=UPI00376F84E9
GGLLFGFVFGCVVGLFFYGLVGSVGFCDCRGGFGVGVGVGVVCGDAVGGLQATEEGGWLVREDRGS